MTRLLPFLVQATLLGLGVAFVVVWFRPELIPRDSPSDPPALTLADAVGRTAPSVVSIYTRTMVAEPLIGETADPLFQRLWGNRRVLRPRGGLGSGVIVSDDGLVLTTAHVIEGVDNIFVALFDGRVAEARVVGADPGTDLAVLRIELDNLPVATFDTDAEYRPGDVVLAIGNPFGLNHTVTAGIVSATGRGDLNMATYEDFIQTDAAINSGNSGGALINVRGDVIGINSASLGQDTGAQGIGFAISARLATDVLRQLVEFGKVQRGWIGANVIDPRLVVLAGGEQPEGVQIAQIYRNGPAWDAGLRPGDILLACDGEPVGSARRFMLKIAEMTPGSAVEITAVRNGRQFSAVVTLIEQPFQQS